MAENRKIIMGWGGCQVHIADALDTDLMPDTMFNIGVIKQNSTSLGKTDGDVLEAKDSFGASVGREEQEGSLDITVTVIEPTNELMTKLGVASEEDKSTGDQAVHTLVVPKPIAVKVTPKNAGATGIKAPNTRVSIAPNMGNDTGNELTLTFKINKTTALAKNLLYTRFKTKVALTDQLQEVEGN